MRRFVLEFISIYQNISFIFLPSCRFYPSCSQYASEAIEKYGLFLGLLKALKRLLHCHPFSLGGYDPA